jgi:sugar phosphate isomerase/epimerase
VIALSTGSLYNYGTARTARLAADAGFDGLEVMVDERWDTRDPAYLSAIAAEVSLPVLAIHAPSRARMWGDEIERVRRTVALAQAVGAPTAVVHPPVRYRWFAVRRSPFMSFSLLTPLRRRSPYLAWLLDEASGYGAASGVTIAVENMPRNVLVGSWSVNLFELGRLQDLRRAPSVALDTTHLGTWGVDILGALDALGSRVTHVHLSDYGGAEHSLPGEGRLPLAPFLRALARSAFAGIITVELVPEVLGAGDDRVVAERLARARAFCRENFRAAPS